MKIMRPLTGDTCRLKGENFKCLAWLLAWLNLSIFFLYHKIAPLPLTLFACLTTTSKIWVQNEINLLGGDRKKDQVND